MEPVDPEALERDYIFASRRLVMYPDLNAAGRLFGGQLMGWMDEGTAHVATRLMKTKHIVTKKFGEVVFDHPGKLGDTVEIWCRAEKKGRTSLTLGCLVLVREVAPESLRQICHSDVVYVALDSSGKPREWQDE